MALIEIPALGNVRLLSLLLILYIRAYTLVDFVFQFSRPVDLGLVQGHKDIYSCCHKTYFLPLGCWARIYMISIHPHYSAWNIIFPGTAFSSEMKRLSKAVQRPLPPVPSPHFPCSLLTLSSLATSSVSL